ncbi:AHH domain-containing protein [Runella sp. SP2]|uniref:AHH domain-containing protein n=1 Tax=Runella sp. SP2 TaxID=2268026 RepID=UPI000F091628|nr:AHH domain-containing protein [Runella sp. SP2]AYQ32954.1 hypothetical protein DTQ70_12680 [Runella sp. SP2]
MRTYENLYQEVYYYVPYGGSEYKVFYPKRGQTAGDAFADAGSKLVFDVGVMIATGGGASVSEVVVTNVADAFISALEESNGDLSKFKSELAINLALSSFDFAEAAGPVFKNLVNKFKPSWGTFTQAARTKLNTLRTQTGWLAQMTSHKNSLSPKLLPNYGKVIKGSLSTVVSGLSSIGAKIDHKNKQILDAGGKVIATFKDKAIKFTDKVIPAGWTKKETLYDVEVEEIVNGVPTRRKVDVEVYEGSCVTSPNPNKRVAAGDECKLLKKVFKDLSGFADWKNYVLDKTVFRQRLATTAKSYQLASQYWNNRHLYPNHPAFQGVSSFDDFFQNIFLTGYNFQAHHVLSHNILSENTKLQELLHWGFQNNHNFDFAGEENGVMMLAYKNMTLPNGSVVKEGHHGNAPKYDNQVRTFLASILGSYSPSWSPQDKIDAIKSIKRYISCLKSQVVGVCATATPATGVNGNPLNSLTINCQ